ncbi:MAG: hypothetical protein B7Z29_12895 [Hyphomicrobium sp. 12-62-95]|nr:MAG: hypothetical protein B7Z29_12895 [Hyphomicrobium sp. 12-62-95]
MLSVYQSPLRQLIHTAAALAVLASLFPSNGELPDTPAGVRTAFELIDKRGIVHSFNANGLKLVSRS